MYGDIRRVTKNEYVKERYPYQKQKYDNNERCNLLMV